MKGGAVSSLQIWIYKLLEETKNDLGNQLKVSVARVRRDGVLSKQGHERDNLLISMMHEGDAGWLGKHPFLLQFLGTVGWPFYFPNANRSQTRQYSLVAPKVLGHVSSKYKYLAHLWQKSFLFSGKIGKKSLIILFSDKITYDFSKQ